jgi:hypothetical protein
MVLGKQFFSKFKRFADDDVKQEIEFGFLENESRIVNKPMCAVKTNCK